MNRKRSLAPLLSAVIAIVLIGSTLSGCGTSSPSPSPSKSVSSPSSSPAASSPSSSAASPSASASAKPASPEEQAYQKAQDNWKQVLEAARKEAQPATVYSVYAPDTSKAMEDAFNKLDPKIQVKIIRMTGAVAIERIKGEQATKQYATNLYLGGSPTNRPMADMGQDQLPEDLPVLSEPGVKWIVQPLMDKPHETVTIGFDRYHFLSNTTLVPAGQEPKTWKDLADPKWKNKLVIWDPRIPSIGRASLATLYYMPDYGPDVVRKIVDNIRVVSDPAEVARMVARGEMSIGVSSWGDYVSVRDAPIKTVSPEDGVIVTPLQASFVKNAPQPNTTKVFLNWLLGKDGQKALSTGYATIRPDVDFVEKSNQVAGLKFLPNVPSSWDFEMTKVLDAAKIFGKWLDEAGK